MLCAGVNWKKLSEEQKAPYVQKSLEAKKVAQAAKAEWEKVHAKPEKKPRKKAGKGADEGDDAEDAGIHAHPLHPCLFCSLGSADGLCVVLCVRAQLRVPLRGMAMTKRPPPFGSTPLCCTIENSLLFKNFAISSASVNYTRGK
jgi:hypothetical protein